MSIYNIRILKISLIVTWSIFIFPLSSYLGECTGEKPFLFPLSPPICFILCSLISHASSSNVKPSEVFCSFSTLSAFPLIATLSFISFLWKLLKYKLWSRVFCYLNIIHINIYKCFTKRFKHNILPYLWQTHTFLKIWLSFFLFLCTWGSRIPPF